MTKWSSITMDMLKLLWRRDSEAAVLMIIGLTNVLSKRDARQMADYLAEVAKK